MDVLVLIDKLDDLVHNAKAVPLTDQVRIDREEIYDILDQMRATIPEEIKQARWIVKERQEMLAEAKGEQDRLLQGAREQAVREASQTEIVKLAERQAEGIIDQARPNSRQMRPELEDGGGQRYVPVPEKVPAAFEITRANTGTVFILAFTARLHGPCYRCLGDAVLEVPIRAREYQAESPEDDQMTTPYIVGNNLDVSAW